MRGSDCHRDDAESLKRAVERWKGKRRDRRGVHQRSVAVVILVCIVRGGYLEPFGVVSSRCSSLLGAGGIVRAVMMRNGCVGGADRVLDEHAMKLTAPQGQKTRKDRYPTNPAAMKVSSDHGASVPWAME